MFEFQSIPAAPGVQQPSTPATEGVSLIQMKWNRQPNSFLETESNGKEAEFVIISYDLGDYKPVAG